MSVASGESPSKALAVTIRPSQHERIAVRAAFRDRICRKIENAAEVETHVTDVITEFEENLALLEDDDEIELAPDNVELFREVLLEFGQQTDSTIKSLVRRRQEDCYFDAEDIIVRSRIGRHALSLARQLVSEKAPNSMLCPEAEELSQTRFLNPGALTAPTLLMLPRPDSE